MNTVGRSNVGPWRKEVGMGKNYADPAMELSREQLALSAKVAAHRDVALAYLERAATRSEIDITVFNWPHFLFIPAAANPREYWIGTPPDDHRYALDWTIPTSRTNMASRENGFLTSFALLPSEAGGDSQSSETAVGIFYDPQMNLGVVDFQPHVEYYGTLKANLNYFPTLTAGSVEVIAELQLAAWQVIPGG